MEQLDQEPVEIVEDELASLKAKADLLGLRYHPSVGVEKLREKIQAHLAGSGEAGTESEECAEAPQESLLDRRRRKRLEAAKLVRVRVTCMNPFKKEWEGEIFTAGNGVVGTHKKYVPFNAEDGWHVPQILLNQIKERKCQIFTTIKDDKGNKIRKGKMINEFVVEVLPALTKEELHDLAQRQALSQSVG